MGKMSELSLMIDTLISCGETLAETGRALKECFTSVDWPAEGTAAKDTDEKKAKDPPEEHHPAPRKGNTGKAPAKNEHRYSKEEVRGILARTAAESGGRYRMFVRELVRKYANGGSLTDVPEECYAALVKETEELKK